MLEALQASPGAVVSMGSLLRRVWGLLPTTKTRTLDTHVYRLRRAGYQISRIKGGLRLDGLPSGGAPGFPGRSPGFLDGPMLASGDQALEQVRRKVSDNRHSDTVARQVVSLVVARR